MPPVEYLTTDIRDIEIIRPLWTQLNEYMHSKTTSFQSHFGHMTFHERKAHFEKVSAYGFLRVDLACNPRESNRPVGYCVSSLSQEKNGEIESIFVEEAYRSGGIGSALIMRALAWFDENGSVRNRVSVTEGNEGVWDFYRKFGFFPRMMVLEQKKEHGVQDT